MAQLLATMAQIVRAGKVYPDSQYAGGKIGHEEVYMRVSAIWRGEEITCSVNVNRYEHSEGWSEWRYNLERTDPGVSDVAHKALRAAVVPLCQEWMQTDAYHEARMAGFAAWFKREIERHRATVDGLGKQLERYGFELDPVELDKVTRAISFFALFEEAVEKIGEQ